MKKLITVLYALITVSVNAQQYTPLLNNSEWYLSYDCPFLSTQYIWHTKVNDVIIGGKTYHHYTASNGGYAHYVREDALQKKVWILDRSFQEVILYDFNLTVGDTFTYEVGTFVLTLEDTINTCLGQKKRMTFSPLPGQFNDPYSFKVIEGVGSLFNPFDLFFTGYPFDGCSEALICSYQNSMVTFKNPGTSISCPDSCSPIWTSINEDEELKNKSLTEIYPNPVSKTLNISLNLPSPEIVSFTFYNSLGQAVKELKMESGKSKNEIDILDLHRGFYFLSIKGHGWVRNEKILKGE